MTTRLLGKILLGGFVACWLMMVGLALWLQPIEGDITRIGGFSENFYGWNAPQQRHDRLYGLYHQKKQPIPEDTDVIVFGDSISHAGVHNQRYWGWQNFFIEQTGLSVGTFHYRDIELEDLLAKFERGELKPKVFVFEWGERSLVRFGRKYDTSVADCQADTSAWTHPALPVSPVPLPASPYQRELGGKRFKFDEAAQYLRGRFLKGGVDVRKLSRDDLFSNRASDEVLILTKDLRKGGEGPKDQAQTRCALMSLQNRVMKTGDIYFVYMAPPDKSSVYAPYIVSKHGYWGVIENMMDPRLHAVRLDLIFEQALEQGVQDLFLPNDTHWGWRGHQLAAQGLYRLLMEQGVIATAQEP